MPGSSVRAVVRIPGALAEGEHSGASHELKIQGTLVRQDSQRVLFLVPSSRVPGYAVLAQTDEPISIPRRDVLNIAVRRIDPRRTAGLVAAIVTASAVALLTTSTKVGGTTSRPPVSGDVSIRGLLDPGSCC
jgi:hypothetical protein